MFSNFAPQRREAGWGRRGRGFMPVVNEFGDIESIGTSLGGHFLSILYLQSDRLTRTLI